MWTREGVGGWVKLPHRAHEHSSSTTDPACRGAGQPLVARRDYLPDLSAQLSRHQRRRRRRPARHHRSASTTSRRSASRPSGSRRSSSRRWRISATTSPTTARWIRSSARSRTSTGSSRRRTACRAQGHHRPGAEPHLRPARLVRGKPAEPRQSEGGLVRVGRCARRRHAAQQLAVDLRRRRLDVGAAPRAVLPAQLPERAAGPELPQSGSAAARRSTTCASGSIAASTACASTRSTSAFTTRSCATTRRGRSTCARRRAFNAEQSLRFPVAPLQQHAAGDAAVPRGHPPDARRISATSWRSARFPPTIPPRRWPNTRSRGGCTWPTASSC